MEKTVEFNNKRDQFQAELRSDTDKIRQCPGIVVFVDKTNNIYKMNTKDNQKLLKENITVSHKKVKVKLKMQSVWKQKLYQTN